MLFRKWDLGTNHTAPCRLPIGIPFSKVSALVYSLYNKSLASRPSSPEIQALEVLHGRFELEKILSFSHFSLANAHTQAPTLRSTHTASSVQPIKGNVTSEKSEPWYMSQETPHYNTDFREFMPMKG